MADETPRPQSAPPGDDPTRRVAPPPKDFLESPALSEMLESMPSYLARGVLYVILFVVLSGALYAYLGKMDVVVKADGSLIPLGETAVVQSAKTGRLGRVLVKEGDVVKAGQLLAELDVAPSSLEAERRHAEYEMRLRDRACVRYAITVIRDAVAGKQISVDERSVQRLCSGDEADMVLGARKAQLEYEQTLAEGAKVHPIQMKNLEATYRNKVETVNLKKRQLEDAERDLARTKAQLDMFQEMFRLGLAAQVKLMEEQKKHDEAVSRVTESRVNLDQVQIDLEDAKTKLDLAQVQHDQRLQNVQKGYDFYLLRYRTTVNGLQVKLANLESTIAAFEADTRLMDYGRKLDRIVSPLAGVVTSVRVKTAGEVVKAGDTIFTVNPTDQPLVAKVMVPNRGVGRLKVGQSAKLKLDAYPYQNYGILTGRILEISPDSKPTKNGSVYEATVSLDRDYLTKGGTKYRLFTGLAVEAEVVIEKRRIIDNFLDPFRKLKS